MKKIVRLTESDLARIVKRVIKENSLLTEGVPNTTLTAPNPITVVSRSVCGSVDYIKASVILQAGPEADAYINFKPNLKGFPTGLYGLIYTSDQFNVTIGNKPQWSNPEGQNQARIPKGKKATLNFVIMTDLRTVNLDYQNEMKAAMAERGSTKQEAAKAAARKKRDDRNAAFQNLKSLTLLVRYNGQNLEVPVNFGGFIIDGGRACDAPIELPKGF